MMPQSRGTLDGEHGVDNEANIMLSLGGLGQILMPNVNRVPIWAQQHEIEIHSLRVVLQEKDHQIAELGERLQEIQQKNNDLQIKLNTKDEEVNELKERIQTLEDEKKDLQEELSRAENKLKRLESEIKGLTKASKSHEKETTKLKEDLQKVEYKLEVTKSNLTQENEKLKREVKQIKETRALPAIPEPIRQPVLPSEESMAMLHLGELCWQIQGTMYKKILPEQYTELRSYKVKSIMKDVRKLVKVEDKRKEAEAKFKLLKSKLNWNEDFEDAMKSLQETRNIEAHPRLDEPRLRRYAEFLESKGQLKGYISLERVNELINIWKQLGTDE